MSTAKRQKRRATQAEKKVASDLGGRRTFLSGAGNDKADVVVPSRLTMVDGVLRETSVFSFRVEVKTTTLSYYGFRAVEWLKVVQAADKSGQIPMFVIEVSIRQLMRRYAAAPTSFIAELIEMNGQKRPALYLDLTDNPKRSIRVSRADFLLSKLEDDFWYHRFLFEMPKTMSEKKGDITVIDYDHFLTLVAGVS